MNATYTVTGMSCSGCEQNVENALTELDGVDAVTTDHETDTVTIDGDFDERTTLHAIEDTGYSVEA